MPAPSRPPFRVIDPASLGIDVARVVTRGIDVGGTGQSESADGRLRGGGEPAATAASGSIGRGTRLVLILMGCAICVGAGKLAQRRMSGLLSPSGALASSGGESRAAAAPVPAQARTGAPYDVFDRQWTATSATVTRVDLRTDPRTGAVTGELRMLDAQGRESRRSAGEILALRRSVGVTPGSASSLGGSSSVVATVPGMADHADVVDTAQAELNRLLREAGLTISWLELTDGQRWSGQLSSIAGEQGRATTSDEIAWISPVFGSVRVPLDQVQRIVFAESETGGAEPVGTVPPGPIPAAAAVDAGGGVQDVVRLRNGDVLSGLVESVGTLVEGQSSVRLDAGKAGKSVVPVENVAQIVFSNPATRPSGTRLFLSDGSALAVQSLTSERDGPVAGSAGGFETFEAQLSIGGRKLPQVDGDVKLSSDTQAGASVHLDRRAVWGIVLDARRLVPLEDASISSQSPGAGRRWSLPAERRNGDERLGLSSIELGAPMNISWELPPASELFAATIELGERSGPWSDCVVVVWGADAQGHSTELGRATLGPNRRTVRLSLNLGASMKTLAMSVDAGRYGAVQDCVRIRDCVIITAAAPR